MQQVTSTWRPVWALVCILVSLPFVEHAGAVRAQSPTTIPEAASSQPASQPPSTPRAPSGSEPAASSEEVLRLQSDDGRSVPVPRDVWREFEDWLRARNVRPDGVDVDFDVTSVSLVGEADDTLARLTAAVKVRINRKDQWVQVPLGFNEAVLQDVPEYRGPDGGEQVPGQRKRPEDNGGLMWWFRGQGEHELTLPLRVPLQRTAPSRRLQLALPAAVASHLELTVPVASAQLQVVPPPGASFQRTASAEDRTQIDLYGLGEALDLEWRQLPKSKREQTLLESTTRLEVDLTSELLVLVAEQTIEASRGSKGTFDEVAVRLPAGFEPPNVEGDQYAGHAADPRDPQRVVVTLTEPTTGPVQLRWTLEASSKGLDNLPAIEGFDVEGASRQTGDVDVLTPEGFRASQREGLNVYRRNVNPAVDADRIANAFRFYKQPFRLTLDVREIPPYFEVEPFLLLHLMEDRLELSADLRFDVFRDRGAVGDVELLWPGWQSEGWEVDETSASALVQDVDRTSDPDGIRLQLASRRTGQFRIPFRAVLPIPSGGEPVRFSLPSVVAPYRLPAAVVLYKADNVEAELQPQKGTVLRPLPPRVAQRVEAPALLASLRQSGWHVDSPDRTFSTSVTIHERTIRTASTTRVEVQPQQKRLSVTQRIRYDVEFERLAQLGLSIPAALKGSVRFFADDGSPLDLGPSRPDVAGALQASLPLPEARIGEFEVVARYGLPLDVELRSGDPAQVSVPLVLSADAPYASVRLEQGGGELYQVSAAGEDWQREFPADGSIAWVTTAGTNALRLELSRPEETVSLALAVRRCLIRTVFDVDGHSQSQAQYLLERSGETLIVEFPRQIVPDGFWLEGEPLDATPLVPSPSGVDQYELSLPEAAAGRERLLTIQYHAAKATGFEWSDRHELFAPELASAPWIDHTVWQVRLPASQLLFVAPSGFSHEFTWRRAGAFWFRQPKRNADDLAAWVAAGLESADSQSPTGSQAPTWEPGEFSGSNAYQFERFGAVETLQFRAMAQSLVVLLGAGLALLGGFLLLKIPATRHVMTVLVVLVLLAVTGLWYASPMQLLLQPAALGLALAVAAALLDLYLKRRRQAAVVTLSPASDLLALPSTESALGSPGVVSVGSELPTVAHRPESGRSEPVSSLSELGTDR